MEVSYNFTVASAGNLSNPVSHVDTLGGLDDLGDVADPVLLSVTQPTVSIQVLDKHHGAVYYWSIEKMQQNIQRIRGLSTYIDRPSYSRHLQSSDCFYNSPPPEYSFIGNALISTAPIYRRISSTSTVPIFCRYTAEAIGSCRVDIKIVNMTPPSRGWGDSGSSTRSNSPLPHAVPSGSKLGFFLTVDSVKGLSSHEYSSVHLQVRLSSFLGTSVASDETFCSTPVDIDQGSLTELKFRRTFSIAATSRVLAYLRNGYAPIEFFARVNPSYIEKLERWNEMREMQGTQVKRIKVADDGQKGDVAIGSLMRRPETDFVVEQIHSVIARLQICELGADGQYSPVPVISAGQVDPGCFQLRQGIQRRIALSLSCSSGKQLPFTRIYRLCMGNIRLLDGKGRIHESPSVQLVDLPLPKEQLVEYGIDGIGSISTESLWDSGSHGSVMLNRVTEAKNRVLLQMQWFLVVKNCLEPIRFSMDVAIAIRSRDAGSPSRILTLLASSKITNHSWSFFKIRLTPPLTRSPKDLWRLDTSEKYVRGEEKLIAWTPRGISCVEDYERLISTERRAADVQSVKALLAAMPKTSQFTTADNPWQEEKGEGLLRKCLDIWMRPTPRIVSCRV
jgi:kinesin family member 1